MLKIIIIDDMIHSVTLLKRYIEEIDGVEVAATYIDGTKALSELKALKPDIIFLDIEMPNANGIDLAKQIAELLDTCEIVFVTAYDRYALDAFGVQASDYVLKPVNPVRLQKTIDNIVKRRARKPLAVPHDSAFSAKFMGDFALYGGNGEMMKWRTKKVKELCAYLLHYHKPVHRTQIIDDLWPQTVLNKAYNALHTSVYQLRKELERQGLPNALIYADERYLLSLDVVSDVMRIERMEDSVNVDNVHVYLELNPYEYLEREDYLWSFDKRVQMRNNFVRVLEKVYDLARTTGELTSLSCKLCLEMLLKRDPYNERYVKRLMDYYMRLDQPGQAVQSYERFRDALWKELQEKPRFTIEMFMSEYNQDSKF